MCRYYRLFWLDSLRATQHADAPLAQNRQVTRVRRHRASPLLSSSLPPGPKLRRGRRRCVHTRYTSVANAESGWRSSSGAARAARRRRRPVRDALEVRQQVAPRGLKGGMGRASVRGEAGREAQGEGGKREQESVRVSRVEPAWTRVGRHLHPLGVLELQRHEANEHRLGGGKGGGGRGGLVSKCCAGTRRRTRARRRRRRGVVLSWGGRRAGAGIAGVGRAP